MATQELKALITLAGKIDPSLQKALLEANRETKHTKKSFMEMASSGISMLDANIAKLGQLSTYGNVAMTGLKTVGKATISTLMAVSVAGVAAVGSIMVKGYDVAASLTEVQNVVDKTFESSSKTIDNWSTKLLDAYGLSELSGKKYASTMGAMLKSQGIKPKDTLEMSQTLTQLTGDMASFYNLSPEEMFGKLRAGISGETEPLKALGVNMSVANLEAYALSQGITKNFSTLDQETQTLLRYNYLIKATADAQGDFAATSDSAANQQKLLKEQISSMSGEVMTTALPSIALMFKGMNEFIGAVDTEELGGFVGELASMGTEMMPLASEIMPELVDFGHEIMPPILELAKVVLPAISSSLRTSGEALGPILVAMVQFANEVVPIVLPFLEFLIKALSMGANALIDGISLTGDAVRANVAAGVNVPMYAEGGFANRPSIFGEAGPEAAIPIKPGNKRSLELLLKTANLLGVDIENSKHGMDTEVLLTKLGGINNGYNITYAPVINSGNTAEVDKVLRKQYQSFEEMINKVFGGKGRLSFG